MVSLAAKRCRSLGSSGRISGPRACLTGEFASLRTMNAAFDRVRGGAGECARQNRLRPATDVLTAPRLPNECASFPSGARNFVNGRQGYRTVKITSRLAENLDPRLRGPLHSTSANNAAACEPHRAVNAHGHALRRLVDLHHHIGARQSPRTTAAANASLAGRPPDSRFMVAPRHPIFAGSHDVVFSRTL